MRLMRDQYPRGRTGRWAAIVLGLLVSCQGLCTAAGPLALPRYAALDNRADTNLQKVRVETVLTALQAATGLDVYIHEAVAGEITLRSDVPLTWRQVLDVILKMNRLRLVVHDGLLGFFPAGPSAPLYTELPGDAFAPTPGNTGMRLLLENEDIRDFFLLVETVSGRAFRVDEAVAGKLTLLLAKPMGWEQLLSSVLLFTGLAREDRGDTIVISKETEGAALVPDADLPVDYPRSSAWVFSLAHPGDAPLLCLFVRPHTVRHVPLDSGDYRLTTLHPGRADDVLDQGVYRLGTRLAENRLSMGWQVTSSTGAGVDGQFSGMTQRIDRLLSDRVDPRFWRLPHNRPARAGLDKKRVVSADGAWPLRDIIGPAPSTITEDRQETLDYRTWHIDLP